MWSILSIVFDKPTGRSTPPDWIATGRSWGRPYRIDYDRIPAIRCILWFGWPPSGGYHSPIYPNSPIISIRCILQGRGLFYLLYSMPPMRSILRVGYLPVGVRSGPIELESAGYQLGGISYRIRLPFGFRGNSYAARRLSIPQDSPPVGRR